MVLSRILMKFVTFGEEMQKKIRGRCNYAVQTHAGISEYFPAFVKLANGVGMVMAALQETVKKKILIVEDEVVISADLSRILEKKGYEVTAAVTRGDDAIRSVEKTVPDLIFMDIMLDGEQDGVDTARTINDRYNIPIIYLTAHSDTSTIRRATITAPHGYLLKPFSEDLIVITIEMALAKHGLELRLKKTNEELRNLTEYMESVREQERTNIAREIHDCLGQSLTALRMDLSWCMKKYGPGQEEFMEKAHGMMEIIDDTIRSVRSLCAELRPGVLDDLGLKAALEWQANEISARTHLEFNMKLGCQDVIFPDKIAINFFRVFQELITNILRHARATEVQVFLYVEDEILTMKVHDNGVGISEEKTNDSFSFGIMGMRERARFCGGELSISGVSGQGTIAILRAPLG